MSSGDDFSIPRRRALLLVGLVLLAALAIRLVSLDSQDVWWDGARDVDAARRPVFDIAFSSELDIHPPVYFHFLSASMPLMQAAIGEVA